VGVMEDTKMFVEIRCEKCGAMNFVRLNRFGKGYLYCEDCDHRQIVFYETIELVEA